MRFAVCSTNKFELSRSRRKLTLSLKLVSTNADIRCKPFKDVLMFVTVRSILTNIRLRSLSHSFAKPKAQNWLRSVNYEYKLNYNIGKLWNLAGKSILLLQAQPKFIISSIESCFINVACAFQAYSPRYAATCCHQDSLLSTPQLEQRRRRLEQQTHEVVSRLTLLLTWWRWRLSGNGSL